MSKKKKRYGLFDLQDMALAEFLKVPLDLFVDVIENRSTFEEAEQILLPLLLEDGQEKVEHSKELFYAKLTTEEFNEVEKRNELELNRKYLVSKN